jgi:hypothetical protein
MKSPSRLGSGFTANGSAWDGNGNIWAHGNDTTAFIDGPADAESVNGM